MKASSKVTLDSAIDECNLDYENSNIRSLFSTKPIRGEIGIKNFGRYITSAEVIDALAEEGLKPINATELFYWCSTHTDEWRGKYVVALGEDVAFNDLRRVCYASFDGAERRAYLSWLGHEWGGYAWFGFLRESSGTDYQPHQI